MRADDNLRPEAASGRRARVVAFYRVIVNGAFELGEVARIEIEIQKPFPPASAHPRWPSWYICPPGSWPASKLH
jgi:hypothetical protein